MPERFPVDAREIAEGSREHQGDERHEGQEVGELGPVIKNPRRPGDGGGDSLDWR